MTAVVYFAKSSLVCLLPYWHKKNFRNQVYKTSSSCNDEVGWIQQAMLGLEVLPVLTAAVKTESWS